MHDRITRHAAALPAALVLLLQTAGAGAATCTWLGDGGPPAWETYLLDELRPLPASGYRAGTERAVAGLSMGGLGAMKLAAAHPGTFRAVASYSGAVSALRLSLDGGPVPTW
ncbi:alpha/beta hydrolase-fold protein [Streptomyces sp. NPDC059389]|uniref:alpha/beta hydrolase-fold protein n=1 Tax=Streptomyces sp. NPDC059389 TaxID=3346818 RepID=UPI00368A82B0